LISLFGPGRGLIAPLLGVAATCMLAAGLAHAQNLDQGKSPQKLFADGCAACHRSPRGLAKGRYSLTLYWFLKDHYASGPDSAKALASYLTDVDAAAGAKPRAGAKPARAASGASRAPRPPAAVPSR
jgi:hypothetical protein